MVEYSKYNNLKQQQQRYFDFVDDTVVTFPSTAHGNPITNILIEENMFYSTNNR